MENSPVAPQLIHSENKQLRGHTEISEGRGQHQFRQENVQADAEVTVDGRFDVTIGGDIQALKEVLDPVLEHVENLNPSPPSGQPGIPLNIVIQIVGSRGDVQPFVALGKELRNFGHRVRLATHPNFQKLVEQNDLEFFSIGGDPVELMAFMVKNPGMIPGREAILQGEIGKKRTSMAEMFEGCWRSCIESGNGMDKVPEAAQPFIANAIIANPPSYAHIHCAERLRVPLHLMFTMPWSPTQAFPHPLANIKPSTEDSRVVNFLSYILLETITWQGLGGLINDMREKKLALSPLHPTSAPGIIARLKIPYSYAWSPALIPKPVDWGSHISIPGFYFLSLASSYSPLTELEAFLSRGPPPVYIGFGSIVVDDPNALTALVFEAVRQTGVRALVSQGWGELRGAEQNEDVFMLGDCPHDWLFEKVACVVHHGGAGTTAAGIRAGRPTVIIPFFGDQQFWGDMIARAGAGPQPIPHKVLTADKLAAAIQHALLPETAARAAELGTKIKQENGVVSGVVSFHDRLPLDSMRCAIAYERVAVWRLSQTDIRLSAVVAYILLEAGLIAEEQLQLYGPCDYRTDTGAFEPLSGLGTVGVRLVSNYVHGFSDVVRGTISTYERHAHHGQDIRSPSHSSAEEMKGEPSHQVDVSTKQHSSIRQGFSRIGVATIKAPMDIAVASAHGLHNAPKLYGDRTVRQTDKVTDVASGLRAAGKELAFGVYDGFSGVVTQPMKGRKTGGTRGMYKGIARGLGGLLFKPLAGVAGVFGYSLQGIHEEIQKRHGKTLEGHLRASYVRQGHQEAKNFTAEDRRALVDRWKVVYATSKMGQRGRRVSGIRT